MSSLARFMHGARRSPDRGIFVRGETLPATWLYHVNPKRKSYTYDWDTDDPAALLTSGEDWSAPRTVVDRMQRGDSIFVFMKGMNGKPDGVYAAGQIASVDRERRAFSWLPFQRLSRRLLRRPIAAANVRSVFGRLYGGTIQLLPARGTTAWTRMTGRDSKPRHETGTRPHTVEDAAIEAADSAKEVASAKQGFSSSAALRAVLEEYSVSLATAYYERRNFTVDKKGKPYDLMCTNGPRRLFVEVKGTTTSGKEVLLTPNEVKFARNAERMELFIVSGIEIATNRKKLVARGGTKRVISPWNPAPRDLTPIGFSCAIPEGTILE